MRSKILIILIFLLGANTSQADSLNIKASNISIDKKKKLTVFKGDVYAKDERNNEFKTQYAEYKKELNSATISLILDWIGISYNNEENIEDLEQYQELKDSHVSKILQNENFDEQSLVFLNNNLLIALKEKIYS